MRAGIRPRAHTLSHATVRGLKRVCGQALDHAHIIKLYEVVETARCKYLIMQVPSYIFCIHMYVCIYILFVRTDRKGDGEREIEIEVGMRVCRDSIHK